MKKRIIAGALSGVLALTGVCPAAAASGFAADRCVQLAEAEHVYGEPEFVWSDNYAACNAVFACTADGCGDTRTVSCKVSSERTEPTCAQKGTVTHTAVAVFNGQTYQDQRVETLDQLEHTFGEPEFAWTADKSACEATFPCTVCGQRYDTTCSVAVERMESTCIRSGTITYTATAIFNGQSFTDEQVESLPKTDHRYGEPVFFWTEDLTACEAVFTCPVCEDEQRVSCLITVETQEAACTADGAERHTATVVFDEHRYTDTKSVTLEKLGHACGKPEFVWSEDKTSCQAVFACSRCGETQTVECEVTETEKDGQNCRTAVCVFDGREYRDTVSMEESDTTPVEEIFSDVLPSDWFYHAVQYVYDHDLMTGGGNGKFSPNGIMTRAMVVQVLYNHAAPEVDEDPQKKPSFADVPPDAWYYNAVEWACATGVSSGVGNGKFYPNGSITREQFAQMLYNDVGKPEVSGTLAFSDAAQVSQWAMDAVLWATQTGIVNGKQRADGSVVLDPKGKATRAEAASMLKNNFEQ